MQQWTMDWETLNVKCVLGLVVFNPTIRGGAFKARPKQKLRFWHLFVIQMIRKNLTFPKYL